MRKELLHSTPKNIKVIKGNLAAGKTRKVFAGNCTHCSRGTGPAKIFQNQGIRKKFEKSRDNFIQRLERR